MATRPDGLTLEIKRVLPAAPPFVVEAFTDPNELARWWGPAGFSIPSLEIDAVVGHRYRIEMQPPEGDPFYLTGVFRVVDRPVRLSFTFRWEDPDPDDVENIVDLIFKDLGESTEVLLTQGPFKTKARHVLHQDGWTDSFNKLEALLSSPQFPGGSPERKVSALERALEHARSYLAELPKSHVAPDATIEELRKSLHFPLPEDPADPLEVIDQLAERSGPGLLNTPSGRFFGFVIGGALPAPAGADLLTSVWDQNAGLYAAGPAAAMVEEAAASWVKELLGLPSDASFAYVTGTQMAHVVALAAARNQLLQKQGWDVERQGLVGSPPIRIVVSAERHITIDSAVRYLGLGLDSMVPIEVDDQGCMRSDKLREALSESDGPTIVCLQAGNVNSGSFDPFVEAVEAAHEKDAWVHVDGAFGLWAGASPDLKYLVEGAEKADSWSTDAHKWLNVPYDSGLVFCAHPDAHRAAMAVHADYLVHTEGAERDEMDWTPEFSRRARGFAVYAAIHSLGRSGVRQMIEHSCAMARRFADSLSQHPGVDVVNDVVLNQVLARFSDENLDAATKTPRVVQRVQEDGTCWLSGSVWHGEPVMRISVSNWSTTEDDVDMSVEAILRCADEIAKRV